MKILQVVPAAGEIDLADFERNLAHWREGSMRPFCSEALAFCSELSRALFADRDARRFPDIQALAFWIRKIHLAQLRDEFAALQTGGTVLVPRGLVFHIPPANVDTIFIYS